LGNYTFDTSYLKKVPAILRNFREVDRTLERGEAEKEFTIGIGGVVPLTGIIDRLIKRNGTAKVIDYKTGAREKKGYELAKDIQLRLYCLAVGQMEEMQPERIKLSLFYVSSGNLVSIQYTRNQILDFRQEATDVMERILNHDPDDARPKVGHLCSYCEYCGDCEAFSKARSKR
jgi:RecB family exonuclease